MTAKRRSIARIYVEEAVRDHPRARAIRERFPRASEVSCRRWGEVFNPRGQSFRLQKRRPALILAEKHGRLVLSAPPGYGVGGRHNYYFSHMLNCVYDCRYCFLQGMFRSASYVVFVNFEAFQRALEDKVEEHPNEDVWFFSGYDCDSLALDRVTGFAGEFLPFFASRPRAWLELRTKSTNIEALLEREAVPNVVVAFSFTPEELRRTLERGVPSVDARLRAMGALAERGWRLGLRFDPLIWDDSFEELYSGLFDAVGRTLDPLSLHSVSLGGFRLPVSFHRRIESLYPEEPLLAGPLTERDGMVGYSREREEQMTSFCTRELLRRFPEEIFFPCAAPVPAQ